MLRETEQGCVQARYKGQMMQNLVALQIKAFQALFGVAEEHGCL